MRGELQQTDRDWSRTRTTGSNRLNSYGRRTISSPASPGSSRTRPRSSLSSISRNTWVWTVAALFLGLFITAQLQSNNRPEPNGQEYPRQLAATTVERLEAEQSNLKLEITELRRQINMQQDQAAKDKASYTAISDDLGNAKALAGLTPLKGAGLKVTLNDSTVKTVPAGDQPDKYLIHEYFLRDVVNVLWANGAEAISINGERIVATTSIYCVGSTILANDTRMSPPYVISVIGDARQMTAGLKQPTVLYELNEAVRKYGVVFEYEIFDLVEIPAYTGTIHTRYSQPVPANQQGG